METRVRAQGLAGQEELLALVSTALHDPGRLGALVMGGAGFGKTALARAVEKGLEPRPTSYWISGRASLAEVPYGALVPLLPEGAAVEKLSAGEVLAGLRTRLAAAAPGSDRRLPLLVIDDAHHLDRPSAAVLAQLAITDVTRLLIIARPKPAPPTEFLAMWRDGLLDRFDVGPLSSEQAQALCAFVLGGTVLPAVSTTLADAAGGSPLFLLALLEGARRGDQLVQSNGVWLLRNFRPGADAAMIDLVREQLLGRTPVELEVLERVALAEPVPLSWLYRVSDAEAIDTLEEDHLLVMSTDADRMVRTASPVVAEVIRHEVPTARSRSILATAADVVHSTSPHPDSLIRFINWSIDCGTPVPEKSLLRAARYANGRFDSVSALRAAHAVLASRHQAAARVEVAHAHFHLGNFSRASGLLTDFSAAGADTAAIRQAHLLTAELHLRKGGSPTGLEKIASDWRDVELLGRVPEDTEPSSVDPESPVGGQARVGSGSQLLDVHAWMLQGRLAEAEPVLEALTGPAVEEETRLAATVLLTELLTATGRPVAAARTGGQALPRAASGRGSSHTYEFLWIRTATALLRAGAWDELDHHLGDYRPTPTSRLAFAGAVHVVKGAAAVQQGRMGKAGQELACAIEALNQSDPDQLLPYALAMAAYAASLTAGNDRVGPLLERLRRVPYRGMEHLAVTAEGYAAAARAVLYGASNSMGELRTLAGTAHGAGLVTAERDLRELALRLGDATQLKPLHILSEAAEGAEADCVRDYVEAVLAKDAEELLSASARADRAGYLLLAGECLGQALQLLQKDGDRRLARAVGQQLRLQRAKLEGTTTQQLGQPDDATELTRRERDIVTMVINGHTNREIAAHSSLSVRTVEGHLYRIFTKLGINRREELSRADITSVRRPARN
jgi:DNA-binding NarL/FixJ family response regulator